jgi:Phage tail lysozyme
MAQPATRRMGLIAPAVIAAGAVAAWQFGPFDTSPASAGNVTVGSGYRQVLGHPIVGHAKADSLASSQLTVSPSPSAAGKRSKPAPKPSATHRAVSHVAKHTAPAAACTATITGALLPANYAAIVSYLAGHGYTAIAATGIAGNIYQESMGNPESEGTGGGGLIGWTPLPAGFVTGNPAADLQTQLAALLSYNQQWAQYIPALNAAKTPVDAAYLYMTYFERPGFPAAANREGAAAAVAKACGIG